jgi:hypothetical protein
MKCAPVYMWACVVPWVNRRTGTHAIYAYSVRRTRRESIAVMADNAHPNKRLHWDSMYRRGWRCVKVRVEYTHELL